MDKQKLVAAYKAEIVARADSIDPDSVHDWESMALGWAIGKGLTVKEAQEFGREAIRYQS
jgi:hypothetical protein